MARSAVLAGRALSDLVRNLEVVVLMVGVGILVGFRVHSAMLPFLASVALLLMFSFALSLVSANVGPTAPTAEATQAASFPLLAVLVFAATAFAPAQNMPGWLQAYNDVHPVSLVMKAMRALPLGGPTMTPVLQALISVAALTAVFAPLSVHRYRRVA
jgi:ABC-2 type transport system permease protein/oleandomycin transport system permease protein